ncbi:MAG: hypothetical protein ACREYC_12665 [Gammaproteobacteria bacterium]
MTDENETSMSRVDRKTANSINPFICDISARGTCADVARAMRTLGLMVAVFDSPRGGAELDTDIFALIQQTLAAALDYEAQQDEEAKPEPSEHTVKRVK